MEPPIHTIQREQPAGAISAHNATYTHANIANGQTHGWGNHASAGYALNSALTTHAGLTNNPHAVTKTQVGLGNVANVSSLPLAGGTLTGTLNLSTLTASQTLELDASKNIVSVAKLTAFNRDFAGTGSATTVSRSDHNHDATYLGISANAASATKLQTIRTIFWAKL